MQAGSLRLEPVQSCRLNRNVWRRHDAKEQDNAMYISKRCKPQNVTVQATSLNRVARGFIFRLARVRVPLPAMKAGATNAVAVSAQLNVQEFHAAVGAYCNTPLRANVKNAAVGLIYV